MSMLVALGLVADAGEAMRISVVMRYSARNITLARLCESKRGKAIALNQVRKPQNMHVFPSHPMCPLEPPHRRSASSSRTLASGR
jgi:hypothetical protein